MKVDPFGLANWSKIVLANPRAIGCTLGCAARQIDVGHTGDGEIRNGKGQNHEKFAHLVRLLNFFLKIEYMGSICCGEIALAGNL